MSTRSAVFVLIVGFALILLGLVGVLTDRRDR